MPMYAYKCTNCTHTFEVQQRFSDDPLVECPVCQGRVQRVISSVGIVFKGGGFYVTDNRNNGASQSNTNGVGRSATEQEPGAAKSESQSSGTSSKSTSESSATSPAD